MDDAQDQSPGGDQEPAEASLARQRLQELVDRCRDADPSRLGAELSRAADRVDRRRLATTVGFASGVRHRESFLTPETVPLDAELEQDWDPCEDEDWFQGLPRNVQQRLRATWQRRGEKFASERAFDRRRMLKSVGEGACIWLAVALAQGLVMGYSFGLLVVMAVAGAAAGLSWHITRAERFVHAAISVAIYFPLHHGSLPQIMQGDMFTLMGLFYGAVMVAWASAIRGQRKEFAILEGSY